MARRLLLVAVALAGCRGCGDPGDTAPADSGAPEGAGWSGTIEATDGAEGTVILELWPAGSGGEPLRYQLQTGAFALEGIPAGTWGVRAWLDEDGDGGWDGVWADDPEPAARFGLELPRQDYRLVLARDLPEPVLEDAPRLLELYDRAWALARTHVQAGTPENGFAHHYLDEAFSEQIFQWDSCFMVRFGLHGADLFPVMEALDNFYGTQRDDGWICRVVDEADGVAGGDPSDPSEPMINPPLFGWAELAWVRRTGDRSRLPRVLPVLEAYHDWIDANVRTANGLYYTSMLGSGMDNAPRDAAYDAWVDISAQQALGRRVLAELYRLAGDGAAAEVAEASADRTCGDLRELAWNDDAGFFFDLGWGGAFLEEKTLASVWPLMAGCATSAQEARVVAHLADPGAFWRSHVFPSTAADAPSYDPAGHYWRGGVWAPTTFATVEALVEAGRRDLARAASENHLANLWNVYADFVPEAGSLAPDHEGDGTGTLWELYAPDDARPGTRWDDTYLGRQDFVGWSGLGPIALLVEQVVGLEPDAVADTLTWHLHRTDRHGVVGYRFGDQYLSLVAEARTSAEDPVTISLDTSDPFTLVMEVAGRTVQREIGAGEQTFTLAMPGSVRATAPVPAGPFAGHAVLGNGHLAAVVDDDDGSDDPPGVAHLYDGDWATDLLDGARTRVGQAAAARPDRVALDPFFAAYAEAPLDDGGVVAWRTFVGAEDAVVVQGALVAPPEDATWARVVPLVRLAASPHMDGTLSWEPPQREGDTLVITASDGRAVALGGSPTPVAVQAGGIVGTPEVSGLSGGVGSGLDLALELSLEAGPGEEVPFRWVLARGDDRSEALAVLAERLAAADPLEEAEDTWAAFAPGTVCDGPFCASAAANLYAARASSLGGAVPADATGQFVTDGRPQRYPRDAMMVARVLAGAGLVDAAWEIAADWLDPTLEQPSPGEWYARYDALGRAVDRGTGAAFDVPEWDANGYLPCLVEALAPRGLDVAEQDVIFAAMDFLVDHQDADGLWTEGGIVEWEGRLPSTTMTVAEGLLCGARLADAWGHPDKAAAWRAAAARARAGLLALVDWDRAILADQREGAFLWNTSLLFGPVWGHPPDAVLDATWTWAMDEARALGGGVRYFEAEGYGTDLFFFTTASAAEYAATVGDLDAAWDLVAWMVGFSNHYGLAPERIHQDGHGAAPASPLSWCAAELAGAVLALEAAEDQGLPSVDGAVAGAEYRPHGPCLAGTGGDPGDGVALCAVRDGDDLYLGLRTAGDPGAGPPWSFYLAPEDGQGAWPETTGGTRLSFRAAPHLSPAAGARVRVDPSAGTCSAGPATGTGYGEAPCDAVALGGQGMEVRVDLATLALEGPVQVVAVGEGTGGEALLPAFGSLLTDGGGDTVLVTFEVDATGWGLAPGEAVTLSGDRAELGAWAGHAVALVDDGTGQDAMSGDGVWTVTVAVEGGGVVEYKYLLGEVGDPSWDGVEFDGADRLLPVADLDGTGRVWVQDALGVRGGVLLDP